MIKEKWDFSILYPYKEEDKIEEEKLRLKKAADSFCEKWENRSDYTSQPEVLRQALDDYEIWMNTGSSGKPGLYYNLKFYIHQLSPRWKAAANKMDEFGTEIENRMQFFEMRVARIPKDRHTLFLNHDSLKKYMHFLERLFAKGSYFLSEDQEKVINLKARGSYSNWVKMTSGFLSKETAKVYISGKKKEVSFSSLTALMESQDKMTRDDAAKAFNVIMEKHADIAEAELNSVLHDKNVDDDLRKMPRPDSARHVEDDMETEVVDTLISCVEKRFDISRRYYRLKAKLLKVKKLKYHERNVQYGTINKRYNFREAALLVERVFRKLDQEFYMIYHSFLENGQVDAFPKKGKVQGAFCVSAVKSCPVFILLNYNGTLNDVLTLAHEAGHGIHYEMMKKKRHALDYGSSLAIAEVASTFTEDFVLQELMNNADDSLRLSLMMMKLNNDISTIFRQAACYRFEQALHSLFREKGYLSKDEIGALFRKNMSTYMGSYVEQSKGSERWWVSWPHIRYYFYVYSYVSGLLISKWFQKHLKKEPSFIQKYKKFMESGTSTSPKELFKELGVEMNASFWENGLGETELLLEKAESLAKNLGRL